MKYSHKLISEYVDGSLSSGELIEYLDILGLNPEIIEKTKDDVIFELETPTNRGDLQSLIGIAREIAPLIGFETVMPPCQFMETFNSEMPLKIENANDCFYYSCRIIKNLCPRNDGSLFKEEMQKLGYKSGLDVVDISNFVMSETGQPLHIFDLDKIEGGIEIRRGQKGESLVTIDGKKRDLDEGVLVIADFKKVIAIAGIMGGENSEVKPDTKNILIESAIFNPVVVRRGSKKLKLATEASARFERGLDIGSCRTGISRTTFLVHNKCKGEVGSLCESNFVAEKTHNIKFDLEKANRLSGIDIEEEFIEKLFTGLDFKVVKEDKIYTITPPSYRKDIQEAVDVTEEIIKYKKYSSVPSEMPFAAISPTPSSMESRELENVKDFCVKLGFVEVVNLGLTSIENVNISAKFSPIGIENPLSENLGFLRVSLIPEMMENLLYNINHEVKSMDIFELGRVYGKDNNSFKEEYRLAFISANTGDFFTLKGHIDTLFEKCGIDDILYHRESGTFSKDFNLRIYSGEVEIGDIFIPSEEFINRYGLKREKICATEIYLERIADKISFSGGFKELARYPSSRRDFSFLFPEDIIWKDVEDLILKLNMPIERVEFFDSYKSDDMPKGYISVSFSVLFRDISRTLENEEVTLFSERIIESISSELNGRLRGGNGDF